MKQFFALISVIAFGHVSMAGQTSAASKQWVGTFATAAEWTGDGDMPQAVRLDGNTLREVVRVSLGGTRLELQLSNEFSDEPLEINAVYVADALDSCEIDAATATYITFGGGRKVVVPARETVYSDAFAYPLKPLQRLAITICYGETPAHATSHRGSRTNSYIALGQVKPNKAFAAAETLAHWYNITKINVLSDATAIAVLGNSITDGRGSTTDAQNRWTDRMAEALDGQVGVLNLGIGGNCVVEGGLSEPAVKRFDRDILGQKGISHVIIFEGTNDIGTCGGGYERKTQQIIDAYKGLIQKAKASGLVVYGATITPTKGNDWYSHFHEAMRQTVNEWIRESGEFDAVIDFDLLVRDPSDPQRLRGEYSDDWLHLNPAGYEAMGKFAAEQLRQNETKIP